MFNDFKFMLNEFGVDVMLNDETITRKAIISNRTLSELLPDFDDKNIHVNWKLERGMVITYENVKYLVISDVQSKRTFEYKAIIRPMTNSLNYTYETEGYYEEVDRFGNPIWIEEPTIITLKLPCVAYQEGIPTLSSGQIVVPDNRITVIMPDNEDSKRIEMNTSHQLLNHTYKVVDINLLQSGLRIFTMEWTTSSS